MASNRKLRLLGLESFSFWCAKRLLEFHPEWLPSAGSEESELKGLPVKTLVIRLPSQNSRVPDPLTISVDLQRIVMVSWFPMFDRGPWHIDWVTYFKLRSESESWDDGYAGIDRISEFLDRFFNEELVAICTDDGAGQVKTSGVISIDEIRSGEFKRGKATTWIRSWQGSFDQTLQAIGPRNS